MIYGAHNQASYKLKTLYPGNYGTAIVYSAEMQPITKRSPSMLFLFAFWTLGSLYVLVVAYFVMGLQTVMVAGGNTLFLAFYFWTTYFR